MVHKAGPGGTIESQPSPSGDTEAEPTAAPAVTDASRTQHSPGDMQPEWVGEFHATDNGPGLVAVALNCNRTGSDR
ncbi:MAG: hypothetical protein ACKVIQ_19435 [Acidimicrobiales bacterium]